MSAGELLSALAKDPKRLDIALQIITDPKKGIASLDELIRDPKISEESRKRYRSLRDSLENFQNEMAKV